MKELDEMIESESEELKQIEKKIEKARSTGKGIATLVKLELERERILGGWRMLLILSSKIGDKYNDTNKIQ